MNNVHLDVVSGLPGKKCWKMPKDQKIEPPVKFANPMLLVIPGAIAFAILGFCLLLWEDAIIEQNQRSQLISMTNSFVDTFSSTRGVGSPVPATYRRMGMEHFNKSLIAGNPDRIPVSVRMPGLPGFELKTVEQNARLYEMIAGFSDAKLVNPINEHRLENGRLIGRTIRPSIASKESCVACHNQALGKPFYKIGDVMGAFVVESDLTISAWRNAKYSIIAFIIAFVTLWPLARREKRRMQELVDGLKRLVNLETEKRKSEEQEKFLLSHDALTGLANRGLFGEKFEKELIDGSHEGLVVGIFDIDDFKTINDRWGHGAGDAMLVEIASRLMSTTKNSNRIIARLGGDEFAIVIRLDRQIPSIDILGKLLIDAIAPTFIFENTVLQPKCSIGLVNVAQTGTSDPAEILKAADATLYQTKTTGKNGFMVFNTSIQNKIIRRKKLESALPAAIENELIGVVIQPKICFMTGKLMGGEALARWNHDGEAIPPMEFIDVAESIGLICNLDFLVLRKAARLSVDLEASYGVCLPISTNISPFHFRHKTLTRQIRSILLETGLRSELYTMEITETVAVENWETVKQIVYELKDIGVRISLDDFGTGHSSLSYLHQFDFDEIKIDRDFITNCQCSPKNQFIFNSIIDLAAGLGSSIVVEGIENEKQALIAKQQGAHIAQGYLFGKPMELDQIKNYAVTLEGKLHDKTLNDAEDLSIPRHQTSLANTISGRRVA